MDSIPSIEVYWIQMG